MPSKKFGATPNLQDLPDFSTKSLLSVHRKNDADNLHILVFIKNKNII